MLFMMNSAVYYEHTNSIGVAMVSLLAAVQYFVASSPGQSKQKTTKIAFAI
jgi:hypothetical protein